MSELLSDEEDQEAIESDPNKSFIDNQLRLLSLRARVKKERSLAPVIKRLEKRSRVIESQLNFDKKEAAGEVQKAVQSGYLARLAVSTGADTEKSTHSRTDSDSSDDLGDAWLSVQSSTSEEGKKTTDVSPANDLAAQPKPSAADEIMAEATHDLQCTSLDSDDESIVPVAMFESAEVSSTSIPSVSDGDSQFDTLKSFPLVLPKSSPNISPIKLLQTHLKRADKQAKVEFHDSRNTIVLRFSSARVSRRKVIIEETKYKFPDEDTARNYLSLKALFSVPELVAEKAGIRFSGVFRAAWKLLEHEEEDVQRALVASKLQSVRRIQERRSKCWSRPEASGPQEDSVPERVKRSGRNGLRDVSDHTIQQIWSEMQCSQSYITMQQYRQSLPIAAWRDALIGAIQDNQVTILCGETGCGKSTQLPTFILEHELSLSRPCKIYVTEPRRISAISLANRVSAELGEHKKAIAAGESLLGFSIRLDSQISDTSRLIYATTGIVLRMLEESNDLSDITHLIIDEVHERSIESDFLLIVVKRLLRTRRDLKVVLMSATLQAERFNDYFGGHCCIFNVPGRTFPVEQYFLEDSIEASGYICEANGQYTRRGNLDSNNDWEIPDEQEDDSGSESDLVTYSERTIKALKILDPYKVNFDLIYKLLEFLEREAPKSVTQAILIFLPGMGEIRRLMDVLQAHKTFGDYRKWVIHALHSSIASDKQQAAFEIPHKGTRKIVIATNIAETGITIPDITCVIDAGKHKESRFDARRQLSKLVETFISRANAKQRMGRAGRVQAGVCYHLFSKARYEKMAEHQLPELQRLNLDELALRVKTVQMGGIEEVLLEALDAPTQENVKRSINSLIEVGALDAEQNLTMLGKHLAKLPVDATLGKLILYGVRYSCLDPCLVIAAALSSKSPFENPMGREREAGAAKQLFVRGNSDFQTIWTAYSKWRSICRDKPQHESKFCRESYLSQKGLAAIEELRLQYVKILIDSGLLQVSDQERRAIQRSRFISSRDGFVSLPAFVDVHSNTPTYVEACLASAFHPNLINLDDGFRTISKGQNVTVHASSVNAHSHTFPKRWMVFYNLLKTKVATNAHDTGLVDDYIVALFCGSMVEIKPYSGTISLDRNRIRFATRDLRTLVALALLRHHLERHFADFLDRKNLTDDWLDILSDIVRSFEAMAKQKLK